MNKIKIFLALTFVISAGAAFADTVPAPQRPVPVGQIFCPQGTQNVNNVCVRVCPSGQHLFTNSAGQTGCVLDGSQGQTSCPAGQFVVGGNHCCPNGTHFSGGKCYYPVKPVKKSGAPASHHTVTHGHSNSKRHK